MRGQNVSDDIPGANLSFSKTDQPMVGTKGRILDHIGFDVKNLEAFTKQLEGPASSSTGPSSRSQVSTSRWRSSPTRGEHTSN
jgi:hypothetical protein